MPYAALVTVLFSTVHPEASDMEMKVPVHVLFEITLKSELTEMPGELAGP